MVGGFPRSVRYDMGTENRTVGKIQTALHELFGETSGRPAVFCGKSTCNQRIEAWWSILRKQNAQFWMNLFQTLRDDGLFDGSFLDKALVQFSFMDLIQVSPSQNLPSTTHFYTYLRH